MTDLWAFVSHLHNTNLSAIYQEFTSHFKSHFSIRNRILKPFQQPLTINCDILYISKKVYYILNSFLEEIPRKYLNKKYSTNKIIYGKRYSSPVPRYCMNMNSKNSDCDSTIERYTYRLTDMNAGCWHIWVAIQDWQHIYARQIDHLVVMRY